jgi:hypothetical protein
MHLTIDDSRGTGVGLQIFERSLCGLERPFDVARRMGQRHEGRFKL